MTLNFRQQVSRTMVFLNAKKPFFAVLSLFAPIKETRKLEIAGTDGKNIYLNPDRWTLLTDEQRQMVLCHELLHAALLHLPRRQSRDPRLWNIAADVVTNGILKREGFELLSSSIRIAHLEDESVEVVYQRLLENDEEDPGERFTDSMKDLLGDGKETFEELAQHWQQALDSAEKFAGKIPGSLKREYKQRADASQLNWRDLLWRFLSSAQQDFTGYDRRFVGAGQYLDALDGYSIRVALAIDTSGSIDEKEMTLFQNEIQSILSAYPAMELTLYYADADLYGPYLLNSNSTEFPEPEGGGGTNFRPFFEAIEQEPEPHHVAVYLTDGYGYFPDEPPRIPILWVLTSLKEVPFGETVRFE